MHKSQGEGRQRRRGTYFEYFQHLNGDSAKLDIMDGVVTNWSRLNASKIQTAIGQIIRSYSAVEPPESIPNSEVKRSCDDGSVAVAMRE